MPLYEILSSREARRVFILGMAKNAGKTFTLNHLVEEGAARGDRLGLTSTGRDGEPLDLVTGKAKPRIFCPKGTIVATARLALGAATARLRDEEPTGIETVLGEVIVAEVEREGLVELAGPLFAAELGALLDRMEARGARRILVDGSLDRKAAGRVVRQVVLAVGAVLGRKLEDVVDRAVTFTQQLTIPAPPPWVGGLLEGTSGAGALLFEEEARGLPFSTLMGSGRELAALLREQRPWGLFVGGALGDETFRSLLEQDPPPRLVVRAPTSLFVDSADWGRFTRRGGLCYAVEPTELLAATVNPYSPEGWEFPAAEFLQAIGEALAPLPTFNLALRHKHETQGEAR
ncbi:MAG: hypothetical protein ACOCVR_01275 [Myxococcota bacterium]